MASTAVSNTSPQQQLGVGDPTSRSKPKRSSLLSFKRLSYFVGGDESMGRHGRRDSGTAPDNLQLPALKETTPFGLAQLQQAIPSIVVHNDDDDADAVAGKAASNAQKSQPGTPRPSTPKTSEAATQTSPSPSVIQARADAAAKLEHGQASGAKLGRAKDATPDRTRSVLHKSNRLQKLIDRRRRSASQAEEPPDFKGISTSIPTGELDDPFMSKEVSFSKRGSMLVNGTMTNPHAGSREELASTSSALAVHVSSPGNVSPGSEPARPLSTEEVRSSQRVQSMYEACDDSERQDPSSQTGSGAAPAPAEEERPTTAQDSLYAGSTARANSILSSRRSSLARKEPWETAGGIEDWRDVHGEDVDRYGFIRPRQRMNSRESANLSVSTGPGSPELAHRSVQRAHAALATVAESGTATDSQPATTSRATARKSATKLNSPSLLSSQSQRSTTSSRLFRRTSTANRGRRWADAAGDMLSMEPGQLVTPYDTQDTTSTLTSTSTAKSAKERQREAKWAKMARPVRFSSSSSLRSPLPLVGGGQEFTFDTTSPKLVSRTWKGIPDRWRASAWYAFLKTSARRQSAYLSIPFVPDSELIASFHSLQSQPCVDDGQIDMDVPRTIGAHVMFRRRYRGGQRLLFRLLRALALYFPATGYVQGMAPLAATLLCYYDEERAFVMGTRMWQCRGLAALYAPGFAGLVSALEAFEQQWLVRVANGAVGQALNDVGMVVPSFGTKWYLTLFAYSVPFAAQLRVWDVFMLLGGMKSPGLSDKAQEPVPDLDVLHAVSAALLDGLQEVLCGADFENAMRMLTSPVPVGREDVLLEVARREYGLRQA